jgi:hypothetical protein
MNRTGATSHGTQAYNDQKNTYLLLSYLCIHSFAAMCPRKEIMGEINQKSKSLLNQNG